MLKLNRLTRFVFKVFLERRQRVDYFRRYMIKRDETDNHQAEEHLGKRGGIIEREKVQAR